jgi:hypothetical protein
MGPIIIVRFCMIVREKKRDIHQRAGTAAARAKRM